MRFLRSITPERPDLYHGIHKGLRLFMGEVLTELGRLDTDDETAVIEALAALQVLIGLCRDHLTHEDQVIHPALEALQPGSARRAAHDHADHAASLQLLGHLGEELRDARGPARARAAARLYRQFGAFVGENLLHMYLEETEHNEILWAGLSDAQILGLHERIVAGLSPADMRLAMGWMIPAMRPAERLAMLAPLRAKLPAAAFDDLLVSLRPRLGAEGVQRLDAALRQAA
ncbi:hypothetical protein [Denitromonas iodatirespirans]|uniref:Hemerythrin-like domain-containing protein n=1 Tax=Denitromonas iodatirespirans TaxID=2795389 RepID=A0A944DFW4_DENI1|nr:hypothetical protein [Denitromonas iodatirespirans]MBT0963598.1 hypothetical protein [Denitromonas iodatirespirans]